MIYIIFVCALYKLLLFLQINLQNTIQMWTQEPVTHSTIVPLITGQSEGIPAMYFLCLNGITFY